MDPDNLIRLGAFCQNYFAMPGDFQILRFPNKPMINRMRIPIPFDIPIYSNPSKSRPIEYDEVELELWGSADHMETAMVGFSRAANVLIIREDNDGK